MLTLTRITDPKHPFFNKLSKLYTEAFPSEERREVAQLRVLLTQEPAMYFNAVEHEGTLAGLLVYWTFEGFYYLEYLAVFSEMRNKKIGQQILDWVSQHLKGLWLLEVEPAQEEMAVRRIRYYERNGYFILDRDYLQPAYNSKGNPFPLWIMGNSTEVAHLQNYTQAIKDKVYYRKSVN